MPTPQVNVNIIRAFEGPRHSRLEFLWDCLAEYYQQEFKLHVFANPRATLRHSECLRRIWEAERSRPERYCVLTEFDFLPFSGLPPIHLLKPDRPVVACKYAQRDEQTKALTQYPDVAGAWYVLIDKENAPADLDLGDGGPGHDPGGRVIAQLASHSKGAVLLHGADCLPIHHGIKYPIGVHLFWSRHLHDPPHINVAGCNLGDIQSGHDTAVEAWLEGTPYNFKKLVERRLAPIS